MSVKSKEVLGSVNWHSAFVNWMKTVQRTWSGLQRRFSLLCWMIIHTIDCCSWYWAFWFWFWFCLYMNMNIISSYNSVKKVAPCHFVTSFLYFNLSLHIASKIIIIILLISFTRCSWGYFHNSKIMHIFTTVWLILS